LLKLLVKFSIAPLLLSAATLAPAAQLSTDARGAIPHDLQQLVVIDYRAMENSTAAMNLRNRVMPPELKSFDEALQKSGLNDNHDVDELAFALFRSSSGSDTLDTVGIAQGQFSEQDIMATFRKQKLKATMVRTNSIYPIDDYLRRKGSCGEGAGCAGWGGGQHADQRADDERDAERGQQHAVEHSGQEGHADDDGAVDRPGGIGNGFRDGEQAPGIQLVLDGLSARGQVRFDDCDRRSFLSVHGFVAAYGGGDGEEDEQHGRGKAGTDRDLNRRERNAPHDRICEHRHGIQQPAEVAVIPKHGAMSAFNPG
jgi:hypothetical protein